MKKTAVIFTSKHGSTAKVADMLKTHFSEKAIDVIDLKNNTNINVADYDIVVLGASIHAGNIQNRMKHFIKSNINTLLKKEIALFLCCMDDEKAELQFDNAYPEQLRTMAFHKTIAGGEFIFEKMNFIERFMVKRIAKVSQSLSKLKLDHINSLKSAIEKHIN